MNTFLDGPRRSVLLKIFVVDTPLRNRADSGLALRSALVGLNIRSIVTLLPPTVHASSFELLVKADVDPGLGGDDELLTIDYATCEDLINF